MKMNIDKQIAWIDRRYAKGQLTLKQAIHLMRRAWLRYELKS